MIYNGSVTKISFKANTNMLYPIAKIAADATTHESALHTDPATLQKAVLAIIGTVPTAAIMQQNFKMACETFNKIVTNNNSDIDDIIKHADLAVYGTNGIPIKYKRRDFIDNVKSILAELPKDKQSEILSHFGIQEGACHDFDGLLNNTPLIINDNELKIVADKVKREIDKFTLENETTVSDKNLKEVLDGLIKGFPEFVFYIGKRQHSTHIYSLDIHTLKVFQSALNDPLYDELSDSDKTVLKISILMHDIGKRAIIEDGAHPYTSAKYAQALLVRYAYPSDMKEKIVNTICNHHWFQKYNSGKLDVSDIAIMFREQSDFDISKIFTKADLENVEYDFHLDMTGTKSNGAFRSYMKGVFAIIDNKRKAYQ